MDGQEKNTTRSILVSIVALGACALLWPALLTFSAGDWPSPHQFPHNAPTHNACGPVGAWLAYEAQYYLGDGAYPLLLFLTLAAVTRLVRGSIGSPLERVFGVALLVACTSSSAHLISEPGTSPLPTGHGGVIGFALGDLLATNLERIGTMVVLTASFLVGLLFATQGWILKLPRIVKRIGEGSGEVVARAREVAAVVARPSLRTGAAESSARGAFDAQGVSASERAALFGRRRARTDRAGIAAMDKRAHQTTVEDDPESDESHSGERTSAANIVEERDGPRRDEPSEQSKVGAGRSTASSEGGRRQQAVKTALRPIVNFPTPQQALAAEPYPRQIENWRLPSLELLFEPEYGFNAAQEEIVRQKAKILERTLDEFRLKAQVVEIDTGPVITMFELKLGAGIKVSQIAALSNDIARALKSQAIRVVAPISGKNTIGIEVPNADKERVRLRELLALAGKEASAMNLPLFLGKDAAGEPLVSDLTRMPHLLIAGTTGSGKSVCLNAIILSVLMTKRPDHVKMILIDPKMVELSQFKNVPHLMCPIVTDTARAKAILEWAVTKMDERYELLAEARVKNIASYNALGADGLYKRLSPVSEEEKARISIHLPYIVIVIDELADLMMTSPKDVEHHLSRLAQKSRAVGIHIIVATQRPEAKIVTGLIKSNLPSRICFRVASRMDSRIVLDRNGGEVLLGQGDMLLLPPGQHKFIRAQGTYLEDAEVHAVLEDLGSRAKPEFHPELMRVRTGDSEDAADLRDPLFDRAVRIIIESRRGSVSLLQRRLTIGYSRASRLIDQMAGAGIVGGYKGSQAREVLLTADDWDAIQAEAAEELGANATTTGGEDNSAWRGDDSVHAEHRTVRS